MAQARRALLVALVALWISRADAGACAPKGLRQVGLASWYGPGFHGRRMANGRRFNRYGYAAASRTLPLGTLALVTHLANGRTELVTIEDRGPYIHGRLIDVSEGTADRLGFKAAGIARVSVEVVGCKPELGRYRH